MSIEQINKYLADQGKSITGQILHRVVWSETATEFRKGTFIDRDSEGTFIREVTEVRETLKYPIGRPRWVFEKWAPGNLTRSPELPNADNGDYIPVYDFLDVQDRPLPVTEKVVRWILDYLNGRIDKENVPDERYFQQKQYEQDFDIANNHPTFTTTPGVTRDSIAYSKEIKDATYSSELSPVSD